MGGEPASFWKRRPPLAIRTGTAGRYPVRRRNLRSGAGIVVPASVSGRADAHIAGFNANRPEPGSIRESQVAAKAGIVPLVLREMMLEQAIRTRLWLARRRKPA